MGEARGRGHPIYTIDRKQNQPRCQSTNKRVKKLWHINTTEFNLAIKKNEIINVHHRNRSRKVVSFQGHQASMDLKLFGSIAKPSSQATVDLGTFTQLEVL